MYTNGHNIEVMKRIITLLLVALLCSCGQPPHRQKEPMGLKYAIYFQENMVVKEYHFFGSEKAQANVAIGGTWGQRYNYIELRPDGLPGFPICIDRSLAPIDIIGIIPEENNTQ